jgi:hypothetical protein
MFVFVTFPLAGKCWLASVCGWGGEELGGGWGVVEEWWWSWRDGVGGGVEPRCMIVEWSQQSPLFGCCALLFNVKGAQIPKSKRPCPPPER